MARFAVGAVIGVMVGVVVGAALGIRAQPDEVEAAALEAGVDATDLRGALNTTGLAARDYLVSTGELEPPRAPVPSALERRIDCIIARESHGVPTAVNRSSGASGLGQFLRSTWLTTPQGRAGLSVFDAAANRAAVRWMLEVGRAREFAVVTMGLC